MGQLNNLYVSSSYQGLLKMTDSTHGVTGTLQTVQTGDGTNTPLQISTNAVNISGSVGLSFSGENGYDAYYDAYENYMESGSQYVYNDMYGTYYQSGSNNFGLTIDNEYFVDGMSQHRPAIFSANEGGGSVPLIYFPNHDNWNDGYIDFQYGLNITGSINQVGTLYADNLSFANSLSIQNNVGSYVMTYLNNGTVAYADYPQFGAAISPYITGYTPTPIVYDTDALTYLTAVSNAGGTTGNTINTAVNNLFLSLKSANLYSKLQVMYPFVGGTDASNSINGLNPGTKDIIFHGGWTQSSDGSAGNASNAWADTQMVTTVDIIDGDKHYAFYNKQVAPNGVGWDGVWDGGGGNVWGDNLNTGDQLGLGLNSLAGNQGTIHNYVDCFIGTINGSLGIFYEDGAQFASLGVGVSFSSSFNYYLGCMNTSGGPAYYNNYIYSYYSLGTGLNPTEVSDYNTIIKTFITQIGR